MTTRKNEDRPDVLDTSGRAMLTAGPAQARVIITGDLCPENRLEKMLVSGDLAGVFGRAQRPLADADLTIVNLEAPLCRRRAPIAKLGPNFRADPRIAVALADAGVDVCCLANNHVFDQGPAGLAETIRNVQRAGLASVGAGRTTTEAIRPLGVDVNGLRIAIVNFGIVEGAIPHNAPVASWDILAIRRAVAKAADDHDIVLPILHAGKEEMLLPAPGLRDLARELIDAGAGAVVGHHPHVPQGIELHRGRPIVYSLGNFLFDWHEPEPHTDSSFLLELGLGRVNGLGRVVELAVIPFAKSETGGIQLLAGRRRAEFVRFINDISRPLTDSRLYRRLWRQQCREVFGRGYAGRLARGANIESADADARLKAALTFINVMVDDEHGQPVKEALLLRALGKGCDDAEAKGILARLDRRLRSFASR